jgi:hypothetical protein
VTIARAAALQKNLTVPPRPRDPAPRGTTIAVAAI